MRRVLITVLAILGAVPIASGLMGIVLGPEAAPGGAPTSVSVDSEYRFTNVFWLAAGVALWWSLLRPDRRALVTRTVLAVAGLGGFARLISILVAGWPHPIFVGALVLELVVVPAVLWWHFRVIDTSSTGDRQSSDHHQTKKHRLDGSAPAPDASVAAWESTTKHPGIEQR